jgi:3-hydroxyisobutyrate dehydrogenase-like beta-hydroxyacid dehydrogenase
MDVGFIGLGSMGQAMAANLLRAGHILRIWNRSPEKVNELVALGAQRVAHPADTVTPDGIVITMVSDDAALDAVVNGPNGIGERLGAGGIHVSMSTVAPSTSVRLAKLHRERGTDYVAAPVFGRPDAAAAKLLFILLAGPKDACTRVTPLLEAMGQKTFLLGEDEAHANIIKLGGNFMIMAAIEAMAETMTLGEKFGVPREQMIEVIAQSIFPAPLFVNYGRQIASHTYEPARFKLSLGLKDANLVLGAASSVRVPMPLGSLMQNRFLSAMAKGRGDADWTSAALAVSEDAGLGLDEPSPKSTS